MPKRPQAPAEDEGLVPASVRLAPSEWKRLEALGAKLEASGLPRLSLGSAVRWVISVGLAECERRLEGKGSKP